MFVSIVSGASFCQDPHEGQLAPKDSEVDRAPAVAAPQVPKLSMLVFVHVRWD